MTHNTTTQDTQAQTFKYDIVSQTEAHCMTHTTQDTTQDAQPSIYNAQGKIDITARRNAVITRMRADNTVQDIWDSRVGVN